MTIMIEEGKPDFIIVSYDVHLDNVARAQLHRELLRSCFAQQLHQSVYGFFYTEKGHQAILAVEAKYKATISLRIWTPKLPLEQLRATASEYETKFAEEFTELEELIEFMDEAAAGNTLNERKKDSKGKPTPFTAKQLYNKATYAYYLAKDILRGLEKRKEFEMEMWKDKPEKQRYFQTLELKLRKNMVYLGSQMDSFKHRMKYEEKVKETAPTPAGARK